MGLERSGRQVDVNGLFLFIRLRRVDAGITAEYPFVSSVGNEMQSAYQLIQRIISVVEDLGESTHFHLRFRSAGHFVFGKRKIVKFPGGVLAPLISNHQIGMLTGVPFPDEPGVCRIALFLYHRPVSDRIEIDLYFLMKSVRLHTTNSETNREQ